MPRTAVRRRAVCGVRRVKDEIKHQTEGVIMMKRRKTVSAILSAVTACSVLPAFPAVQAAETALPDWVPTTYADALEFRNTYGTTHVQDNLACIVTLQGSKQGWERFPLLGSGATETLMDEWFMKDENYVRYFHVTVYKPLEAKTFVYYDENLDQSGEVKEEDWYIFAVDENLNVTETDWRGYVPDCRAEYRAFIAEAGENGLGKDGLTACNIDGRGRFVVMAASSNGFAGSYMEGKATVNGKKLQLKQVGCNYEYDGPEPTDQGSTFVQYCEITEPCTIEASFEHATAYEEPDGYIVRRNLTAAKDSNGFLTVTAADEPAAEEEWRKFVPDTSAEAYTFLRSEGLVSSSQPYNEFNIDNRGDYLIVAAATYGGLSSGFAMIEIERDGAGLRMQNVDCKPAVTPGMAVDGECLISYVKITEPCTITANIRNGAKEYQKQVKIFVTKDEESKLCFEAEDEFFFLPKSFEEAEAFYKANGPISEQGAYGDYIVCCGETNRTTGYDILVDTAGSADAQVVKKAEFSWSPEELVDGANRTYQFYVIRPTERGKLKVTVRRAREWDRNDGKILQTKFYYVQNYLMLEEMKVTMGDLDNSGDMTAADLVVLGKYLGGTGTLEEREFFAADLRNDNRITAADLSVMKRQLMELRNPPPPAAEA